MPVRQRWQLKLTEALAVYCVGDERQVKDVFEDV